MISAVATDGSKRHKVRSFSFEKELYEESDFELSCPICSQNLIFVREGSDGTIPHFRHENKASHVSVSEGKVHLQAKKHIYEELTDVKSWQEPPEVEFEKKIDSRLSNSSSQSLYDRDFAIADIVVEDEYVVEVQCSRQGWSEFKKRTRFYNDHGYKVLWVLGEKYIRRDKKSRYICDDTLYKLRKSFDDNVHFFSESADEIFLANWFNYSAKTRAAKLLTYECNISITDRRENVVFSPELVENRWCDLFRFDGCGYDTFRNRGSDYYSSEYVGDCPYCGGSLRFSDSPEKHIDQCEDSSDLEEVRSS